jgi:hypothetical protein
MGTLYVVRYMRFKNCYPVEDYLNLTGDAVKARMLVLAKHFAKEGRLSTDENGHWLHGDYAQLYEFKPGKHRVIGFIDGTSMYLAVGAPKRRAKAQDGDYRHALTLQNDFFTTKAAKAKQAINSSKKPK